MQDKLFSWLNVIQYIREELLYSSFVHLLQKIKKDRLNVLWSTKDVDVISNMGKKQVMIVKANTLYNALVIEQNGVSLKIDIKLHVF